MPRPNTAPPLQDEFGSFTWKEWLKGLYKEQYYTSGLYRGSGVPDNALGSDGDYYFRTDGTTSTAVYYKVSGSWSALSGGGGGGGSGTVTSVAATGANGIGITGSPITTSGTLAFSLGAITPTSVAATGTVTGSNLSGTNTGDQLYTETEIDFGTTPVYSKTFTIVDGTVSGTTKIMATPSGNVATGRVGNDNEWDSLLLAVSTSAGQFELTALATPGPIVGKRKIFYQKG